MKRSHLTIGFLSSFLLALFCLRWWQQASYPLALWSLLIAIALASLLLAAFAKSRPVGFIVFSSVLGIAVAAFTVQRTTHVALPSSIEDFAVGQKVEITGTIVAEPDKRPTQIKYVVDAETLAAGGKTGRVTGRVLASDFGGWPEHLYGERVTISGKLKRPEPIDTFAYDDYLSISDIYAIMTSAKVQSISEQPPLTLTVHLLRFLYAVKRGFENQIDTLYSEPHASLLAGLLTGSRRGIPDDLMTAFKVAGLAHIVAISGYNITIIMLVLSSLLFWLPLKWRFLPLCIGIILFTLFVGASSSVVRAAIMGILGLIALQSGRQTNTAIVILLTAFLMLLWNPKLLWFDAGFQLSFLAVIGIAVFKDPLEKILRKVPSTLALRESLVTTLVAQIGTTPLSMFLFGRVSLLAPISNLLVAPLIPPAMLFGFVSTTVSFVFLPFGQVVAYVGWICLELIILIAQGIAAVPFGSITW